MRYPDHLHYCVRRCQRADSSHERGRGRVPRETVRSSIVAQNGPSCTGYVSYQVIATLKGLSLADYAAVTYPAGNRAERRFDRLIGNSAALESVLEQVEQVAPTDSTVLIEGETGTGKELIAHAIHNASQRCGSAFIKLNCAAIPLDLLESELFGHEKGAFTGAIAQKIGRFEMADKGTLFLDEVGDIPPALQPKLLRVLQEQEFERLWSGRTH